MEINGQHMGTSSVSRGLARHRMSQDNKAKQASDKAAHPKMPMEGENGGSHSEHDHAGESGGHEMIQQVHSEHGPAHTVETKKDGEHHTVTTTHEDGHMHASHGHPSVQHVSEHIGHSAGGGGEPGPTEGNEPPAGADGLEAMGLGGDEEE